MRYDEHGNEIPDPTPVDVPLNWRRPPSLQDQIKQFVRTEMSRQALEEGDESFEEANDFDVGDDSDLPLSAAETAALMSEEVLVSSKKLSDQAKALQEGKVPQELDLPPEELEAVKRKMTSSRSEERPISADSAAASQ